MKGLIMWPAALTLAATFAHAQGQQGDAEHPPTLSDNPDEIQNQDRSANQSLGGQERQGRSGGQDQLGATGQTGSEGDDTYHDWSMVDKDQDGQLSTDEAREALPDLVIVDINNDGMLNRSEAESAMPGLSLGDQQQGQAGQAGSGDAAVNEQDYLVIITTIEDQNRRDQAMVGDSAGQGQSAQQDEES